jgi:hypothetical protein
LLSFMAGQQAYTGASLTLRGTFGVDTPIH